MNRTLDDNLVKCPTFAPRKRIMAQLNTDAIDAVDGDTVENRILKFGSDPTILAGITRGPQNDHSYFFHDLLPRIYVDLVPSIHYCIL